MTEEEITAGIEELREQSAQIEVCDEGHAIAKGDYVQVNYEGFVAGKLVKELRKEGVEFQTGAEMVAPEIDNGLLGALKGEERDIRASEGDVVFRVKITEIKKKILPEINDDLAKDTGEGETLAELKEKVKARVKDRKEEDLRANQKITIIKKLIELNPVESPASLYRERDAELYGQDKEVYE